MRSLFQNVEESHVRSRQMAGVSIAVHALLLALIVAGSIRVRRTVIFRPMIRGSSSQIAVVAVSRGALASILAAKSPMPPENSVIAPIHTAHRVSPLPQKSPRLSQTLQRPQQADVSQPSAGKSNPGVTGQGNDAQSMYPAYPTVSPSPQVRDRSLLPATDQKIVVDVDLGADGRVQQAKLVSGLNNALDQIVLDTVRGWQFHPAVVNGAPVASQMELVFPFNKNYPAAE